MLDITIGLGVILLGLAFVAFFGAFLKAAIKYPLAVVVFVGIVALAWIIGFAIRGK